LVCFYGHLLFLKGVKIHATVRKQLLYLFQKKSVEGQAYKLTYFSDAHSGFYRTTPHAYKFFFQMRTKVNVYEGSLLPVYGLNLTSVYEIIKQTIDSDFLVGVWFMPLFVIFLSFFVCDLVYINILFFIRLLSLCRCHWLDD